MVTKVIQDDIVALRHQYDDDEEKTSPCCSPVASNEENQERKPSLRLSNTIRRKCLRLLSKTSSLTKKQKTTKKKTSAKNPPTVVRTSSTSSTSSSRSCCRIPFGLSLADAQRQLNQGACDALVSAGYNGIVLPPTMDRPLSKPTLVRLRQESAMASTHVWMIRGGAHRLNHDDLAHVVAKMNRFDQHGHDKDDDDDDKETEKENRRNRETTIAMLSFAKSSPSKICKMCATATQFL